MADWQIGDVKITRVVEFEAALPGGGEGSMVEKAYPDAVKEIGWLRRRAGHGGAAVQQGGLLRGASYGRRHGDIVKAAAEAAKSPAVGRPAPAAGAQTWHP